jgi:ATP-dependent Clp protease ATP-binding subunit ClpB
MLPFTIFILLSPYFSSLLKLCTATAFVLTGMLSAVVAYYRWLKPCPVELRDFRNLTEEAEAGQLSSVVGRDKEIEEVLTSLVSLDKGQLHPLLIGESGVGKTEIIKGVAQKIASGKVPALKGVKLFYINTATILGNATAFHSAVNFIERTFKELQGFESRIILVFDEIHTAAQDQTLAEYLKTRLDPGPQAIRCIGLTTLKEYQEHIEKNDAFAGRFRQIKIQPPTNNQVFQIIKSYIQQDSLCARIKFSKKAIHYMIDKTNQDSAHKRSQPARSKTIAGIAIARMNQIHYGQNPELDELKRELENLELNFRQSVKFFPDTLEGKAAREKRHVLKKQIEEKEQTIGKQRKQLEKLGCLKHVKEQTQQSLWSLAAKIKQGWERGIELEKEQKQFLLSKYYSYPLMKKVIKEMLASFEGIPVEINQRFIEQLLQEKINMN